MQLLIKYLLIKTFFLKISDELVDRAVFTLKENPLILPVGGISLLLIVILIGLNAWKNRKTEKPVKTTKKSVKKSN